VQVGIRLLPVLVNFWEDFGGVQFYVNAALGPGQQPENFYTHLGIRNYFKRWVRGVGVSWRQLLLPGASTFASKQLSVVPPSKHRLLAGTVHNFSALNASVLLHRSAGVTPAAESNHTAGEHPQRAHVCQRPHRLCLGAVQRVPVRRCMLCMCRQALEKGSIYHMGRDVSCACPSYGLPSDCLIFCTCSTNDNVEINQ
jgi:hypothetical protein